MAEINSTRRIWRQIKSDVSWFIEWCMANRTSNTSTNNNETTHHTRAHTGIWWRVVNNNNNNNNNKRENNYGWPVFAPTPEPIVHKDHYDYVSKQWEIYRHASRGLWSGSDTKRYPDVKLPFVENTDNNENNSNSNKIMTKKVSDFLHWMKFTHAGWQREQGDD